MTTASFVAPPFRRDRVTWGGYLALAVFTFFLNIQGNVVPFLRELFHLGYTAVSLHPAALAAGLIVCGFVGDRFNRALGRQRALGLGVVGLIGGAALFSVATHPAMTIAGCFLMGFPGGLILAVAPALLAQVHGVNREMALGEANGVCYGASLIATLTMGLFVAIAWDWRSSMVLGIVLGLALIAGFARVPLPDTPKASSAAASGGRLPLVYWLYWTSLFGAVAVEQTTLLWAPEFLERVRGLSRSQAAVSAAAFAVGMLVGRLSSPHLLRVFRPARLFYLSLALSAPGFALYWLGSAVAVSVGGLFILGLGVATLYPLALGVAIGAAGASGDAASARASLASGTAILTMPPALGALADQVGLWSACLILPVLGVVSGGCFVAARILQRRAS